MAGAKLLLVSLAILHHATCTPRQDDSIKGTSNNLRNQTHTNPKDANFGESSHHEIPYSEHEFPREVSTRPNYTASQRLQHPVDNDFVPRKLYTQVRGKSTVQRLPQKYAIAEAETDEEKENAGRLREVVKNKKINTIYTEEGYEDSAYDHAGHVRNANFDEHFDANADDETKRENLSKTVVYDGLGELEKDLDNESERIESDAEKYRDKLERKEEDDSDEDDGDVYEDDFADAGNTLDELESVSAVNTIPKSEMDTLWTNFRTSPYRDINDSESRIVPTHLNNAHKKPEYHYLSNSPKIVSSEIPEALPLRGGTYFTTPRSLTSDSWSMGRDKSKRSEAVSSVAGQVDVPSSNETQVLNKFAPDYHYNPFVYKNLKSAESESLSNPFDAKLRRYTFLNDHENYGFDTSIEDDLNEYDENVAKERENKNRKPKKSNRSRPKQSQEYKNPGKKAKKRPHEEYDEVEEDNSYVVMEPPREVKPKKRPKPGPNYNRNKRPVQSNPNLRPNQVARPRLVPQRFVRINNQVYPVRQRIVAPNRQIFLSNRRTWSAPRTPHFSHRFGVPRPLHSSLFVPPNQMRTKRSASSLFDLSSTLTDDVINRELNKRFPESSRIKKSDSHEDYNRSEEYSGEDDADASDYSNVSPAPEDKYPYRNNAHTKYMSNPRHVPKKTFGGMEFYDSRTLPCRAVEGEEPSNVVPAEGYNDQPRLTGLGDKLDCFKAKYFDPNPLDNPLFQEKNVGPPVLPKELHLQALKQSMSHLRPSTGEYVPQRGSKRPEMFVQPAALARKRNHPAKGVNLKRTRKKPDSEMDYSNTPVTAYGRQVYDDVMDNIQNATAMPTNHRLKYRVPVVKKRRSSLKNSDMRSIPEDKRDRKTGFPLIDITTSATVSRPSRKILGTSSNVLSKHRSPAFKVKRQKPRHSSLYDDFFGHHHVKKRSVEDDASSMKRDNTSSVEDALVTRGRSKNKRNEEDKSLKHGRFLPTSRPERNSRRNEPRYKTLPTATEANVPLQNSSEVAATEEKRTNASAEETARQNVGKTQPTRVYHETARDQESPLLRYDDLFKQKSLTKRYEVHEVPNETNKTESLQSEEQNASEGINEEDASAEERNDEEETPETSAEERNEEDSSNREKSEQNDEESSNNQQSEQNEEDSEERNEEDANTSAEEDTSAEVYSQEEQKQRADSRSASSAEDNRDESSERPYSPAENFQDSEYEHLGPRVNKPAFHHPPLNSIKRAEENSNSDSEEGKRFSFPWDDEDDKESQHYVHTIKKYEYPWERRARIAREKEDRPSSSSEEDVSRSGNRRSSYPWYLQPRPSEGRRPKTPYRGFKASQDDIESAGSRVKPVQANFKARTTSTEAPVRVTHKPGRGRNGTSSAKTTMTPPVITNATRVAYIPAVARINKGSPRVEILKTNPKRPKPKSQVTTSSPVATSTNKVTIHFPPAEAKAYMKLKQVREKVMTTDGPPGGNGSQATGDGTSPSKLRPRLLNLRKLSTSTEKVPDA